MLATPQKFRSRGMMPLTFSEAVILDRAKDATARMDREIASGNRAGVILARQRLQRLEAPLLAHRRPNPKACEIVAATLDRAGTFDRGKKCEA